MRIALDANRYSDYVTGVPEAREPIRQAAEIVLPFVVIGELRGGFRFGSREEENERLLRRFLRSSKVSILFADEATTLVYADLFVELRRAGTPIPTNDLWIAALVSQHDLTLFTRDKHFEQVSRIRRI